MRQRFVDEFRIYEEKLFRDSDREHFHRHRANDTLGNLYFRVTEFICTTVIKCMTRFYDQETNLAAAAAAAASINRGRQTSGQKIPLSTVHALYKMMEYYVPVYDAVSFDVDLLCTACKLRAVYRPCNRLSKKSCCQRFNSRCLQCCVEYEFTAGGGTTKSTKRLLDFFCYPSSELECRCHRNYLCLVFPSFMLFASESSKKMVLRMCVRSTLADMMSKRGDKSAMIIRIDSRIAGESSASGDSSALERKHYVDRQYLYHLVSEYAADHFMICGGICSELRSILRISGISNKMYEVVTLLSTIIGQSALIAALSGDVVGENRYLNLGGRYEYAAEDGEHFIGRMRYRLRMMTCSLDQQNLSNTKVQYSYCPSCHVNVSTIVTMLPEMCRPDNMYDISRHQGIYNTDVTRRQAERTQKKKKQQISHL